MSDHEISSGSVYPPLNNIRDVSFDIAIGITKYAYAKGLASHYPEPEDKKAWLKTHIYNFNYESSMPNTWPWPQMPTIQTREMDPINFA